MKTQRGSSVVTVRKEIARRRGRVRMPMIRYVERPDWMPDWRDPRQYPAADSTTPRACWAWEFLRRNPEYVVLCDDDFVHGNINESSSIFVARAREQFGIEGLVNPKLPWAKVSRRVRFVNARPRFLGPTNLAVDRDGAEFRPESAWDPRSEYEYAIMFDISKRLTPQFERAESGPRCIT
jgi:hypothetical protein